MGIAGSVLAVEADPLHQLQNTLMALGLVLIHLVNVQRLPDDVGDGHAGVEGGIGVLENHGGLLAELIDLLVGFDGLSVKEDLAARGLVQVQQGAADGGFAAAGFAHEAQRLTPADIEGDIVHRLEGL